MTFQLPHRLIFVLLPVVISACSTIEPQGPLKAVVEGKIFEGTPRNPEEEKKIEDSQRQLNRQTPIPKEDTGALNFKIPL